MAAKDAVAAVQKEELRATLAQLRSFLDANVIDSEQPMGPAAVFTASVTVFLMIYQRVRGAGSLRDAVAELITTDAEFLPRNRRITEGMLSPNTGSYSQARSRLKLELMERLANQAFGKLMESMPANRKGRQVFILDGTTIKLAPVRQLKAIFPPATNQHGESPWPIVHLLVAHEMESGCAMMPEMDAKFGPQAVSEAELAKRVIARLPEKSIVIADRNFGVFSVAYEACQAGHDFVMRLTDQRFEAMVRKATPVHSDNPNAKVWKLAWHPSAQERRKHPRIPPQAQLLVDLHEIRLPNGRILRLVATGELDSADAAALYHRRQDIETDIRDLKVTQKFEEISAKSLEMVRKEIAASIIAFNLVIQLRRQAARLANVPPRKLSFKGAWTAVKAFLLEPSHLHEEDAYERFEKAVRFASRCKIPNRPNRQFPRQAYTKRAKSTQSQRRPIKPHPK
jgi:hypothetical protein